MIYAFTSYYNKAKVNSVLKENKDRLVSISQFNVDHSLSKLELFAPSRKLLYDYKNRKIDEFRYSRLYKNQLDNLLRVYNFDTIKRFIKNKVLLCYESSEKFCHRHVLREWFLKRNVLLLEYKDPLKIAVIGSRSFNNYFLLKNFLNKFKRSLLNGQKIIIVSGSAKGADSLAEKYAKENNIELELYPAQWDKYGKKAGFIRNEDIIKNSDFVIAFWDQNSKGTKHSLELCKKYNKLAVVYDFLKKKYYIQKVFKYLKNGVVLPRRNNYKSESLN